jgi:ElaB/YqjD/DUF883 family membrane-anchored ribosome-binding protein
VELAALDPKRPRSVLQGQGKMFGRSQPQAQIAELQRRVGTLDRLLSRMSELTAESARDTIQNGRESAADAFGEVARRVRSGAERAGKEAVRLGHRATELGEMSVDRFAKEVGLHPLMVVGIAVGVGAIIGAARYRYAIQNPSPPKRPRRIRKGSRK